MLNALNEVMRESYVKDCEIGLKRWNRQIERAGFALAPHPALVALPPLHRRLGRAAGGSRGARCIANEEYEKQPARVDSHRRPTALSSHR